MFTQKDRYSMQDLLEIVALLRDPETGCPWDKVQTHASLRKSMLEETYEVVDAIDLKDAHLLEEELGDVLLQVAMHAQLETEQERFSFEDVTTGICRKLILRHSHIFGEAKADTPEAVLQNWEAIKRKEKHRETAAENLDSVPAALPALMRSRKIQKRAADYGFDYENSEAAWRDLISEVEELRAALDARDAENTEEELGDLLFAAVNVSRFAKVDAEEALTKATAKFIRRFKAVERLAREQETPLESLSAPELDKLWVQAKSETGFSKSHLGFENK